MIDANLLNEHLTLIWNVLQEKYKSSFSDEDLETMLGFYVLGLTYPFFSGETPMRQVDIFMKLAGKLIGHTRSERILFRNVEDLDDVRLNEFHSMELRGMNYGKILFFNYFQYQIK